MIKQQPEALIFANDRPTSLDDDLYQWSIDAEDLIRRQHARIAELEAELVKEANYKLRSEQFEQRLNMANKLGNEAVQPAEPQDVGRWPSVEVLCEAYEDAFCHEPVGSIYVNLRALALALQERSNLAATQAAKDENGITQEKQG